MAKKGKKAPLQKGKKRANGPEKAAKKQSKVKAETNKKVLAKKRLRLPKTAAVVISLPIGEANKEGLTYAGVFSEARDKIKLSDLGIEKAGLRLAQTGARMLESPGRTDERRQTS